MRFGDEISNQLDRLCGWIIAWFSVWSKAWPGRRDPISCQVGRSPRGNQKAKSSAYRSLSSSEEVIGQNGGIPLQLSISPPIHSARLYNPNSWTWCLLGRPKLSRAPHHYARHRVINHPYCNLRASVWSALSQTKHVIFLQTSANISIPLTGCLVKHNVFQQPLWSGALLDRVSISGVASTGLCESDCAFFPYERWGDRLLGK